MVAEGNPITNAVYVVESFGALFLRPRKNLDPPPSLSKKRHLFSGCDSAKASGRGEERRTQDIDTGGTVSYTHLTLPTKA